MKTVHLVVALPLVLLSLAALVWAAEPAKPAAKKGDHVPYLPKLQKLVTAAPDSRGVKVSPNKARQVSSVPLNDDALEEMLTGLGYEVKTSTYTDGAGNERKYFNVAAENYWIDVCLGGGETYDESVFCICSLVDLPAPDKVPMGKLFDLLGASDSYWGHMILTKNTEGMIQLKAIKCIYNHNLSPALLEQTIDNFDNFVVNSKPIWTTNDWTK